MFAESTIDIYNAYIQKRGNENINFENIAYILEYITKIKRTDRRLLVKAFKIDKECRSADNV